MQKRVQKRMQKCMQKCMHAEHIVLKVATAAAMHMQILDGLPGVYASVARG